MDNFAITKFLRVMLNRFGDELSTTEVIEATLRRFTLFPKDRFYGDALDQEMVRDIALADRLRKAS